MSSELPPVDVPQEDVGPGPDGEKIVDSTYYVLLGVKGNANEAEIKKAYRKQSLINHPDRNPGDDSAVARFQAISEAYAVLSDSNARAVYNKQGNKAAVEAAGGEEMPDPGAMFSQMFGGRAFEDWIGEISLGKDVSKAFEDATTEEEKEKIKEEMMKDADGVKPDAASAPTSETPAGTAQQSTISHNAFEKPAKPAAADASSPTGKAAPTTSTSTTPATAPLASPSTSTAAGHVSDIEAKAAAQAARKAERERREAERAKADKEYEDRQNEKRERVRNLVNKLRDRIRPFVEATKPGDADDAETKRYLERIKEEAHDLSMESFGVEICHLIGEIYMAKASTWIKLHRKPTSNILGVPGWLSRVKEKGKMLSEGWSFLSTGLDVQSAMKEMEKRQEKGEIGEEEQRQIEQDLSGKLLLVAWKGSRFELASILRQVVDAVLTKEDKSISDETMMNRAKAIVVTGAILKSVTPDEADAERRELERLVEEAQRKRKEKKTKGGKPAPAASPAAAPASPVAEAAEKN